METYYKNDLSKAYMILEGENTEKEDYQVVMLKENDVAGILKMDVRYIDNRSQYYYDISGKTSLKNLHEKKNLSLDNMQTLVNDLLLAIQNAQRYMLESRCILLEPKYIYCEKDRYYFCFYPPCELDMTEEFHKLTEFFVREVNYQDEEGVHFAYTLHKSTMEENYTIEEIIKKVVPEEPIYAEEKNETPIVDYAERIEDIAFEESCVQERDTMWEAVRKFLERSKLRKRGYEPEDL